MSEIFGLDEPLPETSEEAALEIDLIYANEKHPFHSRPGLPLRERAIERVTKLFEIKHKGKRDSVAQPEIVDIEAQEASLEDFEANIQTCLEVVPCEN